MFLSDDGPTLEKRYTLLSVSAVTNLFIFRGSCKCVCLQVVVLTCGVIILQTASVTAGDFSCNLQFEDAGKLQESKGLEGDSRMPKKGSI